MKPFEYYARKDVKEEFLRIAKDREVQAWFNDIRGKRPDSINFTGDIQELIRRGMSSFHVSVERWNDPLKLKPSMSKSELDELRNGWDLLIDIDSKNLEFSKIAAELLIEALKFHNIKGYSLKYSGNHGFHIGVPFEAFPDEVNGVKIKDLFPDGLRIIALYLKEMIREFLSAKILENNNIDEICKSVNKKNEDIVKNGVFDPFTAVDIDTILISNRHMFRAPYSINEKSGLVSIPIESIKKFNIEDAKIDNVKVGLRFLDPEVAVKNEAKYLIMQAFDFANRHKKEEVKKENRTYETPANAISSEYFPPCIKIILNGIEDGKKRGGFILTNFLRSCGYSINDAEKLIKEWNKKNKEPLREGYLQSQISWFKRQNKVVLPPNCDNEMYCKGIGVCKPDDFCRTIKNPANYTIRKSRIKREK